MSLNHSPSIVTNGLVMYYDMNNTQKSWKGAPATNLLTYSQDFNNAAWITSNVTVTADTTVAPDGTSTADRILSTGWILQTPGGILNSTTYTYSVYLKSATGSTQSVQIAIEDSGGPTTYPSYTVTNSWQRFTATLTSAAATSNFRPGIRAGDVYAWGAQLEVGSFATPYIPTTSAAASRSTTQAIVDLTGNNTITATSLTYASDGTFNFAGSSYANVNYNSILDLINTVSLCAWVKYTASTNVACIEKSNNNTHYQFQIFSSAQGSGLGGELVFMLQPNASNWVTATVASNDNNWHYVVGTYDRSSTTAKIYIDGVLKNTNAAITTGPISNTADLLIGSRSGSAAGMGGSIPVVKVYNRALSATEVTQNFNALRGRYSL